MSGESSGAVLAGALLLGSLPIIVAGAAVAGTAAAVGAGAKAAMKAAEEHRRRQEQLKIEQCSQELSGLYSRMDEAVSRQEAMNREYYRKMSADMERLSGEIRDAVKSADDSGKMARLIQQARERGEAVMGEARRKELERIRAETTAETDAILSEVREAQRTRLEAADWSRSTAAARAQQEAMARDVFRDAAASVRLIQRLSRASGDAARIMEEACRRAGEALDAGHYQAAAAQAQQVVVKTASMALEYEQARVERDELRDALTVRLESLKEELERKSVVAFEDTTNGPQEEYLDDFTQGRFGQLQEKTEALLSRLRSPEGQAWNADELRRALDDVENVLIPEADFLTRVGTEQLLRYYERLHALEIIGGYMREQGYSVEWAQPVGDDVTQKLVVNFRDRTTGNTISVSLDEDADAQEAGRMAMEALFYFSSGRPVTEDEKQAVREGMVSALRGAGLDGYLSCSGCRGQAASNQAYNSAEQLRALPVRSRVQ